MIRNNMHEHLSDKKLSHYRIISKIGAGGMGDKAQAFEWLDKAFQDRSFFLMRLKVEPLFDSLRDDPRFQDLLRRMGLQS